MPRIIPPQPPVAVRIVEHDGVPVRPSIRFETGTLLPGETLEVPAAQAGRAIMVGTVVEAKGAPPPAAAPAKPKRKRAPRPAPQLDDPAPSPEDFV